MQVKHNDNDGHVDTNELLPQVHLQVLAVVQYIQNSALHFADVPRSVCAWQAFSHFSWEASERNLLVCDIQGVSCQSSLVLLRHCFSLCLSASAEQTRFNPRTAFQMMAPHDGEFLFSFSNLHYPITGGIIIIAIADGAGSMWEVKGTGRGVGR